VYVVEIRIGDRKNEKGDAVEIAVSVGLSVTLPGGGED
jgi:hypothetical protein